MARSFGRSVFFLPASSAHLIFFSIARRQIETSWFFHLYIPSPFLVRLLILFVFFLARHEVNGNPALIGECRCIIDYLDLYHFFPRTIFLPTSPSTSPPYISTCDRQFSRWQPRTSCSRNVAWLALTRTRTNWLAFPRATADNWVNGVGPAGPVSVIIAPRGIWRLIIRNSFFYRCF